MIGIRSTDSSAKCDRLTFVLHGRFCAGALLAMLTMIAPALANSADEEPSEEGGGAVTQALQASAASTKGRTFFPENWEVQIAPWLWVMSLEGDATVRGRTADVDVGFDDLLDQFNFGTFIEVEARKDRLGFYGNLMYADLGTDEEFGPLEIEVSSKTLMAGAGVGYRLGPWQLDIEDRETDALLVVEPYAGVRYTFLDAELDSNVDLLDRSRDRDWLDPVIGARAILQASPNWTVSATGDIGGFDVGSDFTWQAFGLVGYNFDLFANKDASVAAGYRALGQDYDRGSGTNEFVWDVIYHGPLFAFAVRF